MSLPPVAAINESSRMASTVLLITGYLAHSASCFSKAPEAVVAYLFHKNNTEAV